MPHECTTCGRQFEDGSKEMLSGCPNCGGNKFQFQPPGRGSGDDDASTGEAEPADPPSTDAEPADASPADAEAADPEPAASTPEPAEPAEPDASPESATPTDERGPEVDADSEQPTADATPGDADAVEAAGEAEAADRSGTADESGYRESTIDDFRDAEIAEGVGEEDRAQSDARSSAASMDEIDKARREISETEEESAPGTSGRGTPQGPPTESPSGEESSAFDVADTVGSDDDPPEKQPVAGSAPEREEPASEEDTDLEALRSELNDQFESIKITAPGQYELNLMELYDRKEYIISLQEDGRYVIEMADDYGIDDE